MINIIIEFYCRKALTFEVLTSICALCYLSYISLFKFLRHLGLYEEAGKNKRQRPDTDTSSDSAVEDQVIELYDGDVKKFVNDVLVSRQHYLKRDRVETGKLSLSCHTSCHSCLQGTPS